jgi:GntR family transcriptional regulator, transcriptional repressor for pyruvate dehydrogenase complex
MAEKVRSNGMASRRNAVFSPQLITGNKTLADQVTEVLKNKMVGDEFAGSQLPSEQAMAEGFGVSRTVIREAISRLKSEGLIHTRQGRGAFVRADRLDVPYRIDLDAEDLLGSLLYIIELRQGLDAEIAYLAAERRNRDQVAGIRRALADIERASKAGHDAVPEDLNFHLSIAKATGNPLFPELLRFLGRFLYAAVRVTRANEDRRKEFYEQVRNEHAAIAEGIVRQDPEAAGTAAKTHMLNAAVRLRCAGPEFWTVELRHLVQGRDETGPAIESLGEKLSRPKSRKLSAQPNLRGRAKRSPTRRATLQ